jgi:hypothetical protein
MQCVAMNFIKMLAKTNSNLSLPFIIPEGHVIPLTELSFPIQFAKVFLLYFSFKEATLTLRLGGKQVRLTKK